MCEGAAEFDSGEDKLRGAGGHHCDSRYLPSLSKQVRIDHWHLVSEPGYSG